MDIHDNLASKLADIAPDIVIHTSGPYQNQDYSVARSCIEQGCHYIDLADSRHFVEGITSLDREARERNVLVVSCASTVPCLTAALVDNYYAEFAALETLDCGITTAQKYSPGLATTRAILAYVGWPFQTLVEGNARAVYGWQGLGARRYRSLGWRLLGNCDVPDLAIFPARYPELKNLRFRAGLELKGLHLGLWGLSWLVRCGLLRRLQASASLLLAVSSRFNRLGSESSGFHMALSARQARAALSACLPAGGVREAFGTELQSALWMQ